MVLFFLVFPCFIMALTQMYSILYKGETWENTSAVGLMVGSVSVTPDPRLSSSDDEDEDLHSTDPESREKSKDKRPLCKVKWSRDEVGGPPTDPNPNPPRGPGCGPRDCS